MPKTCTFRGRVTMYSDHGEFPGPKAVDVKFDAVFEGDTWTVTPAAFGAVEVGEVSFAGITLATLVVTLEDTAQGTADPAPGQFTVDGNFVFSLSTLTSTLEASFDCVTARTWQGMPVRGRPYDANTGQLMLSALGTFDGGMLDGKRSAVLMEGVWKPKPW